VLASNNQRHGDSLFTDKYVVDYPLGYFRGGDAFDIWYRLDAWKGPRWRATVAAGILAKGAVDLYAPYETYYGAAHDAPSGVAERELRLRAEGEYRASKGVSLRAGAGWRRIGNAAHARGNDRDEGRAMCGIAWILPSRGW
jgi:hypothetical protein